MYLEASDPSKQGDVALLSSPEFTVTDPKCVQFYYHMYGDGVGALHVGLVEPNSGVTVNLWSTVGEAGDDWKEGYLEIAQAGTFRIELKAERGGSYQGDIAIDDVSIVDSCAAPDGERFLYHNYNSCCDFHA